MLNYRLPLATALALAALVQPHLSSAQTDPMRLAHLSGANQLGIMEYCKDKGWADQEAVDGQKKSIASMSTGSDQPEMSQAEAAGRKGELMNNGTTISLSSVAQKGNTTEQDLCTRMVSAAKSVAAQQSSMPKFPVMPGGGAMPTLPSGMTMPTMPGMPKTQ